MKLTNFEYKGPPAIRRTFLFYLKYLLSFIWPVRVEKVIASNGNALNLVFEYGRLVVNTGEANYSYGNLQRAFEGVFRELALPWEQIENILILGFGSGSVAQSIRKSYSQKANLVGVERDATLIRWYRTYFPDTGAHIFESDAHHFVQNCQSTFDLIVVDLFEGLDVPDQFRGRDFLLSCKSLLAPRGKLLYNFVKEQPKHEAQYADLLDAFGKTFKSVRILTQMDINRIFLAE
ncbi:MAG: hypothetical protein H6606_11330 [Flavobacteriales bacterium]|nr:hypothetical protein [Flavobacteriales bacterium]